MPTKTCKNCGALFSSLNPFRSLCDACQERHSERRSENELRILGIVDGDLEANIWVDMLQQEGIQAIIRQNDALRGRFQTAPMAYSTEVLVQSRDFERAREIVEPDRRNQRGGGASPRF